MMITEKDLSDFLEKAPVTGGHKGCSPRIKLKGMSLSVQAREGCYCNPRNDQGPYYEAEIGFPTRKLPEVFLGYCEDRKRQTKTVYGYVPLSLIVELINDRGLRDGFTL